MKKFLRLFLLLLLLVFIGLGANGGCGGCGEDTVKPQVMLTGPTNNSIVSGIVPIKAEATDNIGVVKVEFYIDGSKVGEDTSSPYEYSWNTDSLQYNSTHIIQAKAYDVAGNVGESPVITVKIGDTQKPEVTITNPASSIVPGSAIITIKASVQDRSKTSKIPTGIQKVEFYVDDNKIGEATASPYACNWDTSGLKHNTTHTITVKAYDNAGNIGTASLSVTINVEWTVLMYLDGHNNLGPYIQNELNYLNNVTSTAGINVVILAGLNQTNPLSYLRYFHNGIFQTLSQGNYNFGDPALLQNFLTTGIQNFPAKKYMLILCDHGSGWRRPIEGTFTRDICWDDIYDSSLTMPELKSSLQYAVSLLGKKIDLVYFDACLMGNVEVDYEIKDLVSYVISSEATAWIGSSGRWYSILNQLVANPTMSPSSLGVLTAQTYFSSYPTLERTIAVNDLSKIDDVMEKIYYFAHYLRDCLPNSASAAMYWRNQTQSFAPYGNYPEVYIDLYQYADFVLNNTSYSNLQNAALALMSSITSSVLYYAFYGYSSAKGYSIWFPDSVTYYTYGFSKYSTLDFSQSTYGNEWFWFLYDEFTALQSSTQKGKVRIDKK